VRFEIVTIFPDFFVGPLDYGIVRRARNAGLIEIGVHDLRTFTQDRHRTVDDRPFGGGEGMLLKPDPLFECVESLGIAPRAERVSGAARESVVILSASGKMFSQAMAQELAGLDRITFLCGRYEGVDERVTEHLADREVSVGDFVMSGGELGAALILDCVTRLLPGALGNEASNKTESFSGVEAEARFDNRGRLEPDSTVSTGGLLDYPHYTRPAEFRGIPVPNVLMNGNHEEIRRWRRRRALEKTLRNRPDLLEKVALSAEDKSLLRELKREAEEN
jgi:tRNA (guanine37-N1)-methyltransferase